MRILLTEDDINLAQITGLNLKRHGFAVDLAQTGADTLKLLEENSEYDVIILDLILPDIEGERLLGKIKSIAPNIPVLALTAKTNDHDRVGGLKLGFDDYLTKPFSHYELAARLRALYRSWRPPEEKIEIGPLTILTKSQTILVKGYPKKITLNEFRLLHYLAQNKGQLVPKDKLLSSIWDRCAAPENGKLVTTVSRLRKKIGDRKKSLIKTGKGGYKVG